MRTQSSISNDAGVYSGKKSRTAKKTMKRRRVAFSPTVKVQQIRHLKNYTREEMQSCWFHADDYHRIHSDLVHSIRLMGSVPSQLPSYDARFCGLPNRARKAARKAAKHAVFAEQALLSSQRKQESSSNQKQADEVIARAYKAVVALSHEKARVIGVQQQIEAVTIFLEDLPKSMQQHAPATSYNQEGRHNHNITFLQTQQQSISVRP